MFIHHKLTLLPKLFHTFLNEKLKDSIVSTIYCPYLIALKHINGQTMSDLTKKVFLDKANTSRVIKEMENNELVIIKESSEDRRVKKIYLTDKGNSYMNKIISYRKEWEEIIFNGLSNKDKDNLHKILNHIIDNAMNCIKKIN